MRGTGRVRVGLTVSCVSITTTFNVPAPVKVISFCSSVLNETSQAVSCDPNSPSHPTGRAGTKRKRGRGGKLHRVWSPSGGRSVGRCVEGPHFRCVCVFV